ncbi:hypothetical protein [Piscinibacter defluvii]|uniref:hypothetical protein n=1 Tax=Piscinibacter defluvii TaxID=1796922 RepID=UPI000FDD657A|nr:hypothetical protein [Piscinibacter defluvii]
MAQAEMWKLLHLLNIHGPTLSRKQIRAMGITCDPDTLFALVSSGIVQALPPGRSYDTADEYRLSDTATCLLQNFLVGNRRFVQNDIRLCEPSVFVVMPFGEPWSDLVYTQLLEPAVTAAGLKCLRGDSIDRTNNLLSNVIQAIATVGLVLADLSAQNANVYYELGLCDSLGKERRILKQTGVQLPADLAGAHYIEYDRDNPSAARPRLETELRSWLTSNDLSPLASSGR